MKDVLSPWRLTGMGAPMTVWAVHLVAVYSLQAVACTEGLDRLRLAGSEALAWWLVALTVVALAVLAWLGLRAWRGWHAARLDADMPPRIASRRRFAAAVTGALCVLSATAIVYTTLPVLLLPGCAR